MKNVDKKKVLKDVYLLMDEIEKMQTDSSNRFNGKFRLRHLAKMETLYNDIVKSKSSTPHNLLVCKLLVYSRKLKLFYLFFHKELAHLLSF